MHELEFELTLYFAGIPLDCLICVERIWDQDEENYLCSVTQAIVEDVNITDLINCNEQLTETVIKRCFEQEPDDLM